MKNVQTVLLVNTLFSRATALLVVFAFCLCAQSAAPVDTLHELVMKGDWRETAIYIRTHKALAQSAEGRLANAHAQLALNENNAALCGFASVESELDLAAWERWTADMVAGHSRSSIGHYLRGDALARLGRSRDALQEFGQALTLDPKNLLALNARGVVRTLLGDYDAGLLDLAMASSGDRSFVDPRINRGFLYLLRKGSAASEVRAFDSALALNPQTTLAVLGKSQAMVAMGQSITAISQIDESPKSCPFLRTLADQDRRELFAWVRENDSAITANAGGADAGTTLLNKLKTFAATRDTTSLKDAIKFAGATNDPEIQKKLTMTLQSMEKTDPGMSQIIGKTLNETKIQNETLRQDLAKQGSQKAELQSELDFKLKTNGIESGASVKATQSQDLKAYAAEKLKALDQQDTFNNKLNSDLGSGKAENGGAETARIGAARIENGKAPRIYHNGLLYPAAAGEKEANR